MIDSEELICNRLVSMRTLSHMLQLIRTYLGPNNTSGDGHSVLAFEEEWKQDLSIQMQGGTFC